MSHLGQLGFRLHSRSLSLIFAAVLTLPAVADMDRDPGEWVFFGGDLDNSKYSALDQINERNFKNLELAWRWKSIETDVTDVDPRVVANPFKATPLLVDGMMYVVTSVGQVVALDPGSGELLWEFDTESYKAGRPANMGFHHRGVSYYDDGEGGRIIHAAHDRKLWALDAKTGEPEPHFADGGPVDLSTTLDRPIQPRVVTHIGPVGINRDTIVVGSVIYDVPTVKENAPGHVRGFDARTGAMKWIFHTIPQEGEFGVDTWENDSWKYTGNTNVWAQIVSDEELGYVYLPTGASTNDLYGGQRLGDNLFSNSIVCLNADTGERVWHFQAIHHGLWDYDFPTGSNLADVTIGGKKRKILAQVGKTAFCYVLDRETGEPIWPIVEKPVPQSRVPGERTSPTQPFPTKPAPYDRQGLTVDDLIDFTPELRAKALQILEGYELGPIFTPPNAEKGTLGLPSVGGGTNWRGAALDPESGVLYVPSFTNLQYWHVYKPDPNRSNQDWASGMFDGGARDQSMLMGLPMVKPPYSRVTAIDLKSGEHLWMTAHGSGPVNHPLLKGMDLPPLGNRGMAGGPLVTKSLLFVTSGGDRQGLERDQRPNITVFDKKTGKILGVIPLPGRPSGNPMTYMHEGQQYIAVAIGGGGAGLLNFSTQDLSVRPPAEIVAFRLP